MMRKKITNNVKEEEKMYTTSYIIHKYGFKPFFLDTGIDIPDCYYEHDNRKYAVEVTRYFQQKSEKEYQEYVNVIEKCLAGDFFKDAYSRLGKKKPEDVTISFYNGEELKNMIINNIKYIQYICIDNNVFINKKEKLGDVFLTNNSATKMTINDFINYVSNSIMEEKEVEIEMYTKNKYSISFRFKYYKIPFYGLDNDKKVIPGFCWSEIREELYGNIVDRIKDKNNKLLEDYIPKLKKHNIEYDYYNLVLYPEGFPSELDVEILFDEIKKINNLRYNEIAIFLWGIVMVISDDTYKIYSTSKYD